MGLAVVGASITWAVTFSTYVFALSNGVSHHFRLDGGGWWPLVAAVVGLAMVAAGARRASR